MKYLAKMNLSEYLLHVTVQVKDLLLYIDVISGHGIGFEVEVIL